MGNRARGCPLLAAHRAVGARDFRGLPGACERVVVGHVRARTEQYRFPTLSNEYVRLSGSVRSVLI